MVLSAELNVGSANALVAPNWVSSGPMARTITVFGSVPSRTESANHYVVARLNKAARIRLVASCDEVVAGAWRGAGMSNETSEDEQRQKKLSHARSVEAAIQRMAAEKVRLCKLINATEKMLNRKLPNR